MKLSFPFVILALGSAGVLTACGDETPAAGAPEVLKAQSTRLVQNEVVGVSVNVPERWHEEKDKVLFDKARTYGFVLYGEDLNADDFHRGNPVANIRRFYDARPEQLEELVRAEMELFQTQGFPMARRDVVVGNGLRGVAVTGGPGGVLPHYTVVFVAAGDHVYYVGLWSEQPELDARAHKLLADLRFEPARRSVASLGLASADSPQGLGMNPEKARLAVSPERDAAARLAVDSPVAGASKGPEALPEVPAGEVSAQQTSCTFVAGDSLYTQLQWSSDNYNRYSAAYGLAGGYSISGDSAGTWGYWYGVGAHLYTCDPNFNNQYYAVDFPGVTGATAWAAISGTVKVAHWGYGGFQPLGLHVYVKRASGVGNLTNHLSAVYVSPGQAITLSTAIGEIGGTGGWEDVPHIHTKLDNNSYAINTSGGPEYIGGGAMKWTRWACYGCTNHNGTYTYNEAGTVRYYTPGPGKRVYTR
jgi:murein DD-endopeptidase MepM/ murein hydrolase activator NlpD